MPRKYTLHDLPVEERPRERLQNVGVENLSLQELLALIIEKGGRSQNVLQVAQNLLSHFGNLENIQEANLTELQKVKGVGFATACKIKAALSLGERVREPTKLGPKISKPKDVFNLLKNALGRKKKEYFKLICLDSRNRVITTETISIGTLDASLAHPREIFLPAIKNSASSVILVHNHPSGNTKPSSKDKELTQRIRKAGKIIGIPVSDHIIITATTYFSFTENSL